MHWLGQMQACRPVCRRRPSCRRQRSPIVTARSCSRIEATIATPIERTALIAAVSRSPSVKAWRATSSSSVPTFVGQFERPRRPRRRGCRGPLPPPRPAVPVGSSAPELTPINRGSDASQDGQAQRSPQLATGFRDPRGGPGLLRRCRSDNQLGRQRDHRRQAQRDDDGPDNDDGESARCRDSHQDRHA